MQRETANYVLEKTQTLSPLPSLSFNLPKINNLQPRLSDQDLWPPVVGKAGPCEAQDELSLAPGEAEGQGSMKGPVLYNAILGIQARGKGFRK